MITYFIQLPIIFFILFALIAPLNGMSPDEELGEAISRLNPIDAKRALDIGGNPNASYHLEKNHPLLYVVANVHHSLLIRTMFKNKTDELQKARLAIARLLLDHGADPESKESCHGWRVLHLASAEGHTDFVKLLLERGADPNAPLPEEEGNDTPLILATIYGHSDTVRNLLAKGANLKYSNRENLTALDYAKKNSYHAAINILQAPDNNFR